MGRLKEPLSGGLVTDRDPALLDPGQLSELRNLVYKNGGSALVRAPGRVAFGAVSAETTGVVGLRDAHFDNGTHILIAHAGTRYRFAPVGDTGTFADLVTGIASGSSLEVVQYRNRFFLMNGAVTGQDDINTNKVAYLSATGASTPSTRQHGMLPVNAAPNVVTGAGGFSQSVTGYYEYWTTEVARITQDGAQQSLESAFSSDNGVSTVFVSSTGVVPTVQLPAIRNPITTHWRIYRSPKKDAAKTKMYPSGFMIAELSTATASHADASAAASASSLPASFNSTGFYFGWASASSMLSDNGVYASATVPAILERQIQQAAYGFSLGGFSGVVQGIAVEIQGYVSVGSAPCPITATIGRRRSDGEFVKMEVSEGGAITLLNLTASKSGLISSTASGAPSTITLGGATDRWFPTNKPGLTDSDFDGNFMVVLSISKGGVSLGVDYIKVYVYYGPSVDSTVAFPTVVYTFGDITSQVAKNFPPPSSNTGDLFQDSLVVNDVTNPSLVRYSFPGEPESFPPTYFIDFETRENDLVRAIRVVNNRLMVGLDTSLWRINYLPSERDASFDRGKAIEMVSRSIGIVNPMCCTTFTIDGEAEQMAFISHKGMHTTDGFNFVTRSKNQNWRTFIPLDGTSRPIALLNDPENRCLRFFFRCDTGFGLETYLCLWASYDRADIDEEGNFKFSGPVHMRNSGSGTKGDVTSALAVPRSNGSTGIYIGYGGTGVSATAAGAGAVYYETGAVLPSLDTTCKFATRRIYAAGMSGEWMLDDLYGYCGSYSGAPVVVYTILGCKTNDTGEVNLGSSQTVTLGGQKLHKRSPRKQSEGIRIRGTITTTADYSQELLILGSSNFGLEDSGRAP